MASLYANECILAKVPIIPLGIIATNYFTLFLTVHVLRLCRTKENEVFFKYEHVQFTKIFFNENS